MIPKLLSHEEIQYIHEVLHRPLTLEECDSCLEWRRMYGDLRVEEIEKELIIKGLK